MDGSTNSADGEETISNYALSRQLADGLSSISGEIKKLTDLLANQFLKNPSPQTINEKLVASQQLVSSELLATKSNEETVPLETGGTLFTSGSLEVDRKDNIKLPLPDSHPNLSPTGNSNMMPEEDIFDQANKVFVKKVVNRKDNYSLSLSDFNSEQTDCKVEVGSNKNLEDNFDGVDIGSHKTEMGGGAVCHITAKNPSVFVDDSPYHQTNSQVITTQLATSSDLCDRMALLPTFDGKSWKAYNKLFESQLSRIGNISDALKLELLETKLTGKALEYYSNFIGKLNSYSELRDGLQHRFGSCVTPQCRRNELSTIKQNRGESLVEFADRVAYTASEGYQGFHPADCAEIEIASFLQGCLMQDLAERVMLMEHESLNCVLSVMIRAEQNAVRFRERDAIRHTILGMGVVAQNVIK